MRLFTFISILLLTSCTTRKLVIKPNRAQYVAVKDSIFHLPVVLPVDSGVYHILDTALVLSKKLKSNIKADVKRYFLIRTYAYPKKAGYSFEIEFSNYSDYLSQALDPDSFQKIYGVLNYKGTQFLVMDNFLNGERAAETIFKFKDAFTNYTYRTYYRYEKSVNANVKLTYNDVGAYLYFDIFQKGGQVNYKFLNYLVSPF